MSPHEAIVQLMLIAIPTLLLSLINTFGRDQQRVPRLATIGAAADQQRVPRLATIGAAVREPD